MRRVVLEQYIKENRSEFTRRRLRIGKRRAPVRRKRDADEKAVLLHLDKERWDRWMKDGRVEIVGPRSYRMKLLS